MSDLAAALDVVGSRWALLIVERLLEGPQRYGDVQRALGVPTNMLATRLRELEAAGVLSRLPLRHNTRAYALTERGFALRAAIVELGRWGAEEARAEVSGRPGQPSVAPSLPASRTTQALGTREDDSPAPIESECRWT